MRSPRRRGLAPAGFASAVTTSSPDAKRSCGNRASILATTLSRASGTAGRSFRTGVGVSCNRRVSCACGVMPAKGSSPVSASYNTTPSEKMSDAGPTLASVTCSGLM